MELTKDKNIFNNCKQYLMQMVKHQDFLLYVLLTLFIVGRMFSIVFIVPIAALLVYVAIRRDFATTLYMLMFTFSFAGMLKFVYAIIVATCMFIFVLKHIKNCLLNKQKIDYVLWILLVVLILYLCIRATFVSGDTLIGANKIFMLVACVLSAYMISVERNNINTAKLINFTMLGFIISLVFGLFIFISPAVRECVPLIRERVGIVRYAALYYYPSILSLYSALLIGVLMYAKATNKIGNIFYFYIFIVSLSGMLTVSRTFTYILIVAFVVFAIAMLVRNGTKSFIQVGYTLLAMLLPYAIFIPYTKFIVNNMNILDMFTGYDNSTSLDMDDLLLIDPGRGGLFKLYIMDMGASATTLLFGKGINAPFLGIGLDCHNTYLQLLWEVGIVGMILVIAISIYMLLKFNSIKTMWYNLWHNWSYWVLLLPIAIHLVTESIWKYECMIGMVILLLTLTPNGNKQQKDKISK